MTIYSQGCSQEFSKEVLNSAIVFPADKNSLPKKCLATFDCVLLSDYSHYSVKRIH